jgi:hypothetical protein
MLTELQPYGRIVSRELRRGFVRPLMVLANGDFPIISPVTRFSIAMVELALMAKGAELGVILTLGSPVGAVAGGILTLGAIRQLLL